MPPETPSDDAVDAALDAVRKAIVTVLADNAVAAYLHGSTGLRRLRPHSDLDVLVVTRSSMAHDERVVLVDRLLDVSGRRARLGPARPVELTVVVESDVRPWRYPPTCDFQYGEWLRDDFEQGSLSLPAPSPDLALLLTMVLRCDFPLFGPPPAHVLDPVPGDDVLRAAVDGVPALANDLEDDTTNVLLTLARVWHTSVTRGIAPKDVAASWALKLLPREHHAAMQHARAVYLGHADDDWTTLRAAARRSFDSMRRHIDAS